MHMPQLYPVKRIFSFIIFMVYKYFKECLSDCVWDFNCVLDKERDIVSGDQHNARDVNQLNDFVLKSELNDAWRLFSAEQKAYMVEEKPFHSTETGLYIVDRHHSQ